MLELSGIGQPELLQSLGIEVKHELRGVGENYRDHFAPRMNWRVKLPVTLNEQTRGLSFVKEIIKYYTQQRGVLTFTAGIVYGFVKTRPELEEPDVQYPLRPRQLRHGADARPGPRAGHDADGRISAGRNRRARSTRSRPIRWRAPAIRPNFLAEELDRRTHRRGHEDRPADHQQPGRWTSTAPSR